MGELVLINGGRKNRDRQDILIISLRRKSDKKRDFFLIVGPFGNRSIPEFLNAEMVDLGEYDKRTLKVNIDSNVPLRKTVLVALDEIQDFLT